MDNKSAFEILLEKMVEKGFDENDAADLIADAIDEQRNLDKCMEVLSSIYKEAKGIAGQDDKLPS